MKILLRCKLLIFLFISIGALNSQGKESDNKKINLVMRVGLPGQIPVSLNTIVKNGKKSTITEISEDGRGATTVEIIAREKNQGSVLVDLNVTRMIMGKVKNSQKVQILAKEGQEAELSSSRGSAKLSLGVIAHAIN